MRVRWAAGLVALLVVAGCGTGGGGTPSADSTTPPAAEAATPSRTPVAEVPVVKAGGANAAPVTQPGSFYVTGPEAAADFSAWWYYELQSTDDEKRGVQKAYIDGIAVCAARTRGAGETATLTTLESSLGWTGGGAAAIYAAALRSLCPALDFGQAYSDGTIDGYKTYFDKQVNLSYPLVIRALQPFALRGQPNRIDVGWLGKYTCAYLTQQDTSIGLLDFLARNSSKMTLAQLGTGVAQAAAKQVVTHMCPEHMDAVLTW